MAERQVGRAPLAELTLPHGLEQGERHADQPGVVGVERVGLGVEGDDAGLGAPRRSRRRAPPRLDQLVVAGVKALVRLGARRAARAWPAAAGSAAPGAGARRRRRAPVASPARRCSAASRLGSPAAPARRSSTSGSGLRLSKAVDGSAGVGTSSRSSPARARCAPARRCSIRVSRRLGCLISPARRQQRLEVAVLVDQLGGGLDADAGHARHVVDRVAGQRLHVDHLVRA